jgi:hypothetical protein
MSLLGLVLVTPFLQTLFKFAPLHPWEALLIVGVTLLNILVAESVKLKLIRKAINGKELPSAISS